MRFSLFISLIISFVSLSQQGLAYQLPDAVILDRFQATSRHIMAHPTLWQARHSRESWTDTQIQYELLVEYSTPTVPPTLTLFHGPHRYQIESKLGSGDRRDLILKGPLPSPAQTQPVPAETTQGVSPHPLGTFDFVSTVPFAPRWHKAIFSKLGEQAFSGQFQLGDGLPLWVYDTEDFPWRLEMPKHHFFPTRLTWKKSSRIIIEWQFKSHMDYKPWGIASADLSDITYRELDPNTSPSLIKTQTTWTLTKAFTSAADLETWKTKKKSERQPARPTPEWLPTERLIILSAY